MKKLPLLFALSALPTVGFADPNPTGYFAFWDVEYTPPGACRLSTYGYEAGGGLTPLEFNSNRGGRIEAHRFLSKHLPGELRIETTGAPDAWTIPLDADDPRLAPEDVERLLANLGHGNQLVLIGTPKDGTPLRYVATTAGAAAAVAMFKACVAAAGEHASLEDPGRQFRFIAIQSPGNCYLTRWYTVGRATLWMALVASRERGAIEMTTNSLLAHGSNRPRETTSDSSPDDSRRFREKPFDAEMNDLYGAQLVSGKDPFAQYEISLAQVDALGQELSHGGKRKFRLRVKGETTINDTFGGELAIVPAAMFAGCRSANFPVASN